MISLEFSVAREDVLDTRRVEVTSFLVIGGDLSIGPNSGFIDWMKKLFSENDAIPLNISISVYAAGIHNVDNVVEDYAGPFQYQTTTAAYKYGLTFGEAYTPSDLDRELAYSETIGVASGYALTVNEGASYYFPMQTRSLVSGTTTHHNLLPHIQNFFTLLNGFFSGE